VGRADLFHFVPSAVAPALLAVAATAEGRPWIAPWLCAAALALLLVDGVTRRIDILDITAPTARVPGPAVMAFVPIRAPAPALMCVGALLISNSGGQRVMRLVLSLGPI
jgi:hypothetical protein